MTREVVANLVLCRSSSQLSSPINHVRVQLMQTVVSQVARVTVILIHSKIP